MVNKEVDNKEPQHGVLISRCLVCLFLRHKETFEYKISGLIIYYGNNNAILAHFIRVWEWMCSMSPAEHLPVFVRVFVKRLSSGSSYLPSCEEDNRRNVKDDYCEEIFIENKEKIYYFLKIKARLDGWKNHHFPFCSEPVKVWHRFFCRCSYNC